MTYPILQLKPGREKSVKNKHPWIFSGAIQTMQTAVEGDIIEVRAANKEILGFGFFSAESQISCRMFEWSIEPEDFDSPDYWINKLQNAFLLRRTLVINEQTNCYRLLH